MSQLEEKSKLVSSLIEIKCLITCKCQLQFKLSYLKRKLGLSVSIAANNSHLEEISELQEKIAILNRKNKELEELVCILQDEEIITFQNGRYGNNIRECIMELLSVNVSKGRNDLKSGVLKHPS